MSASLSHVTRLAEAGVGAGDLVAALLPPGPGWLDLVREVWEAEAALLPVDPRLSVPETSAILELASPTIVLGRQGAERRGPGPATDRGVAFVVHTSGTAGLPKLVEFERPAIHAAVSASTAWLRAGSDDGWLSCLPPAHIGGLLVLLRGVLLHAPVSIHERFDPEAIARDEGPVFISVVPTMLARMLEAEIDLARFRAILVGGAALPAELRTGAERVGARLVETYGLTESCGGVVYDGTPLSGVDVRLAEETEIELRGPMLMHGYRPDPGPAAAALTEDGWLRTGDAGAYDPEGRLSVLGRLDDLINSGGEKVWPDEVEEVLRRHPKVLEVAVSGRPDPTWGERVVAWAVAADLDDPPTLDELRDFTSSRLARFKAPRELVLVERLPHTVSGKLRRAVLPSLGSGQE